MPRPKAGEPNKSDFIRNHPEVPAAEVVAKAAAAGIKLTPTFVYNVRSRTATRKGAGQRGRRKGRKSGSASDFVRKMPRDMPASAVIAAAAKRGIKMSTTLVYVVRSKGKAPAGARGRRGRKRGRPQGGGADAVAFKRMALGMGLERARQELDELERGLAQLIGS